MKRRLIVLLLFLVLVSAITTPVLAQAKIVFVGNMGMAFVPHDDDSDPTMVVEFLDIERSPCGRADCLTYSILIDPVTMETEPVAAVTDNECVEGYMEAMFLAMGYEIDVVVVDDEDLEVWKKGRTLYAELTVTVGIIHPICAEIKGLYGKPMKMEESMTMPDGSEMTMKMIGYEALAYFVYDSIRCPSPWAMIAKFQMKVTPP